MDVREDIYCDVCLSEGACLYGLDLRCSEHIPEGWKEMDIDEVRESIRRLRERREAIPSLRDYRPQRKGAAREGPEPNIDGLLNMFMEDKPVSEPAEKGEGGEVEDGTKH